MVVLYFSFYPFLPPPPFFFVFSFHLKKKIIFSLNFRVQSSALLLHSPCIHSGAPHTTLFNCQLTLFIFGCALPHPVTTLSPLRVRPAPVCPPVRLSAGAVQLPPAEHAHCTVLRRKSFQACRFQVCLPHTPLYKLLPIITTLRLSDYYQKTLKLSADCVNPLCKWILSWM